VGGLLIEEPLVRRRRLARAAVRSSISPIGWARGGGVSLGQVLTEHRYLVTVDRGGRVILESAVVMTRTEERLLADPALRSAMTAAASAPTEPLDLDCECWRRAQPALS